MQRTTSLLYKSGNGSLSKRSLISTAEKRRERIRATLKPPVPTPEGTVAFGFQTVGNNYDWNWTLNYHDVTPSKDAFRNLHEGGLIERAQGKLDKQRALHIPLTETEKPQHFVINQSTTGQFKQMLKEVQAYLGNQELYSRDAAIGSHRWAEVRVRVIGDNPAVDLTLSHLLSRVPLTKEVPIKQAVDLVVYLATGFKVSQPSKYGLKSSAFSAFHQESGKLILAGNFSTSSLRQTLMNAAAAMSLAKNPDVLPVNADALTVNDQTLLVFNHDGLLSKQSKGLPFQFYGAHHQFWTPQGLVKAWNGVTSPSDVTTKGAVVQGNEVTRSLQTGNATGHPNSIVFLIHDSRGVLPTISKLNASQAAQQFLAGYNGKEYDSFFGKSLYPTATPDSAAAIVASFTKLVQNNNVASYVINTGAPKELKSDELHKLLGFVADGSAAKAPTATGFNTLSPITSLPGFKTLEAKAGGASFDTDLTSFLNSTFPNVKF